jgi:hypothetical protein
MIGRADLFKSTPAKKLPGEHSVHHLFIQRKEQDTTIWFQYRDVHEYYTLSLERNTGL